MGGPYCKDCKFYREFALAEDHGECADPTKIIYYKYGSQVDDAPEVRSSDYCMNWAEKKQEGKEGEG